MRDYLEYLRDDFSWTVVSVQMPSGAISSAISDELNDFQTYKTGVANASSGVHCDLRRMWAYQMVCYHYYTNDKVDYIYSAELFRQYINQLVTGGATTNYATDYCFNVNGLQYQYDALSAYCFNKIVSGFTTSGILHTQVIHL